MTMSAALLVFGVVVLLLATYLIKVGKSSEAVLRIFRTILIIVIAVFLVVAGCSDTQIAPVMGLVGTIAGYLLGKESKEKPSTPSSPEPAPGNRPSLSPGVVRGPRHGPSIATRVPCGVIVSSLSVPTTSPFGAGCTSNRMRTSGRPCSSAMRSHHPIPAP